MKKVALISILSILLIASSCSILAYLKSKDKPVTLSILGDVNRVFDPKAEGLGTLREFQKRNPNIRVKTIIEYDEGKIYKKAKEILSDPKKAVNGPDIIEMPGSWVAEFANEGLLLPITDWFNNLPIEERKDFYSELLVSYTYKGELYGLPALLGVKLLYGRKDLLPGGRLPTTLSELIRVAENIQKNHGIQGFIFPSMGAALKEFYLTLFEIYKDSGLCRKESHMRAYETLKTLVYSYQKDYQKFDYAVSEGEFRSGRAGLSINGNYVWYLLSQSKKVGFPIGPDDVVVGFLPSVTSEKKNTKNFIWTRGYVINANTPNPDEAKKLLRFLCSTEASFWRLRERYILPVRHTVAVYGANLPAMQPLPIKALYSTKRNKLGGVGKPRQPNPKWHMISDAITALLQEALNRNLNGKEFADRIIRLENEFK